MTIEFEYTPVALPTIEEREAIADEMRADPGRVVVLCAVKSGNNARQTAYAVRKASAGMLMFAPAGSFETSSTTMFGLTYAFIRYVGSTDGQ